MGRFSVVKGDGVWVRWACVCVFSSNGLKRQLSFSVNYASLASFRHLSYSSLTQAHMHIAILLYLDCSFKAYAAQEKGDTLHDFMHVKWRNKLSIFDCKLLLKGWSLIQVALTRLKSLRWDLTFPALPELWRHTADFRPSALEGRVWLKPGRRARRWTGLKMFLENVS